MASGSEIVHAQIYECPGGAKTTSLAHYSWEALGIHVLPTQECLFGSQWRIQGHPAISHWLISCGVTATTVLENNFLCITVLIEPF